MSKIDPGLRREDPGSEPDGAQPPPTIRINPVGGAREVQAFARLAAVVDRAGTVEVPRIESPEPEAAIHVHTRAPEPSGSATRIRQEAFAALARAEAEHTAALEHSRNCWQDVHDREQQTARIAEDEAAALRTFELLRESRRSSERAVRQTRVDSEEASRRCLTTARILEEARMRADRL
ncbi:MAG TPA: hypothetical protein VGN59_12420 [Acidimicrobiia bacterium]|jgi:hypothetical protein